MGFPMDEKLIEAIVEQVVRRIGGGGDLAVVPSPGASSPDSDALVTPDIRAGRVMIGVSARHIHLTDEHVEALFGQGAKLKTLRPLMQPGEFASEQTLTVISPGGRCLGPVRVLGPTRKASQVELSLTDCIALGVKELPPIRPSGDHRGTFGITLAGPVGVVTLTSGLIRANRHIHLHTSQATAMGF